MILVSKELTNQITKIKLPAFKPPDWMEIDDLAAKAHIELSIAKFKPYRLPRGYNVCIAICVYFPAWSLKRQESAIH